MPPTRGPYNKAQLPTLTEEQLIELDTLFKTYRKRISCPACKATTTFHRHGSSSRGPTQPQFMCTSCHKYIKAHPMYQLLQCTATFDEQSSQSPHNVELSNTLEDSNTANSVPSQLSTVTEDPQPLIMQLQKTVEYLTAELSKAHEAIQKLQNQITTTVATKTVRTKRIFSFLSLLWPITHTRYHI